jgi:hypothetical protein
MSFFFNPTSTDRFQDCTNPFDDDTTFRLVVNIDQNNCPGGLDAGEIMGVFLDAGDEIWWLQQEITGGGPYSIHVACPI